MELRPDLDEMTPGQWVHYRRLALGLTLEDVAERADMTAAEVARNESAEVDDVPEHLKAVLAVRPSVLLARHRDRVLKAAASLGIQNVRVFGSVARGDDRTDSDIDLIVDLPSRSSLLTIAQFVVDASRILTVPVDVINDSPSPHQVKAAARAEAILL